MYNFAFSSSISLKFEFIWIDFALANDEFLLLRKYYDF